MIFNSLAFLAYFPIVTSLYFVLPHRFRWLLLFLASCVFYMYFVPVYILILFVLILIDYSAGLFIETSEGRKRKMFLWLSILSTCLVLFVFKYFNFFNDNVSAIAHFFHLNYPISTLKLMLPIGLSFHTFQSLSYVIEVYRGRQKAERNLGIYALYVMFYPQLVAGPIERPQHMLHQFHEEHVFHFERFVSGLRLMGWGFFKKMVIADRLSVFVNLVYDNYPAYNGFIFLVATVFFGFQIYCDFSGYSDIAIGSAKIMGFELTRNFDSPYFSRSISEFWRRWHISLSSWFKDYIYIPLGGNRVSKVRNYVNILIVFLVSGLWHGASWNFVIWGFLHGVYLIFEDMFRRMRFYISKYFRFSFPTFFSDVLGLIVTFALVNIAWVFFRAKTLAGAMYILRHMFDISTYGHFFAQMNSVFNDQYSLGVSGVAVLVLIVYEFITRTITHAFLRNSYFLAFLSFLLVISLLAFGVFDTQVEFIYFQF
ncbi:MAG: MBOAT family protein [Candidatus Peregrinibacteria bacterium]|nr:MBOAT family protein [Candidatus Peregrinibacteria bacterium]